MIFSDFTAPWSERNKLFSLVLDGLIFCERWWGSSSSSSSFGLQSFCSRIRPSKQNIHIIFINECLRQDGFVAVCLSCDILGGRYAGTDLFFVVQWDLCK